MVATGLLNVWSQIQASFRGFLPMAKAKNYCAPMKRIYVYTLGLFPMAVFHDQLEIWTTGPVFMVFAVVYLVLVRLVAEKFGR